MTTDKLIVVSACCLLILSCGSSETAVNVHADNGAAENAADARAEAERQERERRTREEARLQQLRADAVRQVIAQDARFGVFADVRRRANDMRTIDLSKVPADFRAGYMDYIHAAEALAAVDEELLQLDRDRNDGGPLIDMVTEGSLRPGLEFSRRVEGARRRRLDARNRLLAARNEVQRVASAYVVFLPREVAGPAEEPLLGNIS